MLHGPLPLSPGWLLTLTHHAHAVWTSAPWSVAVLAAHDLDNTSQLAKLNAFALHHCAGNPFCVTSWMHLPANQVAFKRLVMWKVWVWMGWYVLPYPEFDILGGGAPLVAWSSPSVSWLASHFDPSCACSVDISSLVCSCFGCT